jgi:hypothetical protein
MALGSTQPLVKMSTRNIPGSSVWTGWIWHRLGTVGGCGEWGNEPSVSIKCSEFLYELRTYQLLGKDSAAWSFFLSAWKIT